MRSILEKAIVALLNEQHDEADTLMHRFMVARARQIHESLRHGDESVLDETWNEEMNEEYFTEEDLDGLEASGDAADLEDDAAADFGAETDDLDDAEVDAADADADEDAAMDLEDGDKDGETVEVDSDTLDSIRDELEALLANIDSVTNGGEDAPATEPSMDDMSAPIDDEGEEPSMEPMMDEPMDGEVPAEEEHEEEMHESDDFADLAESITSELEKISVDLGTDGKEFNSKTITQNKTSSVGGKKADASDAKPIVQKSVNHTGFERETAPAVKDMAKKARNSLAKADVGRSTVSKEGDKAALINKDFATGGK